jgi:hypothetical protein
VKKLSEFFYRFSTGWIALAGLVIFLVFSMLTLPEQSAQTAAYSQGLGGPDTSLVYNGTMLRQMAETYGVEGRAAFLKARWTFDLAFPLVFTFFFVTSISWLFNRTLRLDSQFRMINLLPLLGMLFDYAENTATSLVMANYPNENLLAQVLAPIFTPIKWLFVGLSLLLVMIGLVLWIKKRIIKQG